MLTSGQTIVPSMLNECINGKVGCIEAQQRTIVSPQFYFNVLGIVKRIYIYVLLLDFIWWHKIFLAWCKLFVLMTRWNVMQIEGMSFHVPMMRGE
jgi:hypothetical protein